MVLRKDANHVSLMDKKRVEERLFDSKITSKVAIPYSRHEKLEITLMKRTKEEKKEYVLSFMTLRKLIDIPGYEKEWGIGRMEYITLWKNYRKKVGEKPII